MRQITLSLIACALLVTACDAGKSKSAQVTTERTTYVQETPTAAQEARTAPIVRDEAAVSRSQVIERSRRQAQESDVRYERIPERKTYNEKQISDKESTYPTDKSDLGPTYNETQVSE